MLGGNLYLGNHPIIYLDHEHAVNYLQDELNNVSHRLSKEEIAARLANEDLINKGIDYCREKYIHDLCESFLDFQKKEINLLNKMVSRCNNILDKKNLKQGEWIFVKRKMGIDWDFPYTMKHCIVLPESFLEGETDKKCETLIHEYLHVLQKKYPEKVHNLYLDWGFKKENNLSNLPQNTIYNPDGYDYWSNDNILPILIVKEGGSHSVNYINTKFNRKATTEEITRYNKNFPISQSYHPNEIMAVLLSSYLSGTEAAKRMPEKIIHSLKKWLHDFKEFQ